MDAGQPEMAIEAGRAKAVAVGMPASSARRLLILSSLPASQNTEGQWLLPAKFVTGLKAYAQRWPGQVVVGLQRSAKTGADLDNRFWSPAELPFEVQIVRFSEVASVGSPLLDGAVVLVMLNHQLHGLGQRCKEQGAIFVANTELTLATQLQIARSGLGWGPRLIKTWFWLARNHRRALQEIRDAKGLQCNGTPTFDAFARHNPSPLLYFDNRTTSDLCATASDLEARFDSLTQRRRLRLLFSGRLHPIKGVHHLIPLACAL
ncbi:MAG TPA: hypothetical protein VFY22_14000, partial [Hydrogenophaga sp.]|nr:hypothetical protein [Hydrogenophaga sp.]